MVFPSLFDSTNTSGLAAFLQALFELVQIVFSSVLDSVDLERADELAKRLLISVPTVFNETKPKYHYALGHIVLCLRRHGPSPFWSGFAFESRLGDLKRACLMVANNKGI